MPHRVRRSHEASGFRAIVGVFGVISGLMIASATLSAQLDTGNVGGNIVDETKAALPGVTVTVKNLSTGQIRTAVTSERGRYQIAALPPGKYSITAELPGFSTVVRPEVTVNIGSAIDVDISMTVAAQQETLTVTGEAPLVESTTTSFRNVITEQELEALPSKGRQYLDYTLLLPATVENVSTTAQGAGLNIGGARGKEAALLVDGFYNMDEGFALPKQRHSQDAIQEFQVISFGGEAEYGRAIGGIVNAVTKSGGNAVQGTGYGLFRDTKLNAQDPGGKLRGAPKAEFKRRQWGGTIGGPVIRDRSFFFGAYERVNELEPRDNGIRASDAAIIGLPPEDVGNVPRYERVHFAMGKWDHNISANQRLQVSLSMSNVSSLGPRALETRSRGWGLDFTDWAYLAKWTGVSGDNRTLHEVKASYFPRFYGVTGLNEGGPPLVPDGQINPKQQTNAAPPSVSIASVASFGSTTLNNRIHTHPTQVIYSSTKFADRHTIKFGADFMVAYYDYTLFSTLGGRYSFPSLAAFQTGTFSTFTQAFGDPANPRWHQYISGFIQDSWQANDRLTMNYGLRYDLEFHPKHEASGQRFGEDYNNFGPRFALSYDLTGGGTTFLKLASGIYVDRLFQNLTTFFTDLKGYEQLQTATWRPQDPGAPVYPNVFTQRPANLPRSVVDAWVMPDKLKTPTSAQFLGTVEHALSTNLAITGSVVYTRSWDKEYGWDTNLEWDNARATWVRPDPNYRMLRQYRFGGRAEYVGGIVEVTRRGTRTGFNGNLTLSRAYDTGNNYGTIPDDNRIGIDGEWGPMADTPTVRGVVSAWYDITPNIQMSGIFRARSGMAINPVAAGLDLNGDARFGDRTPTFSRNSFRQPGMNSLDLRLTSRLPVGGTRSASLYLEAYNVLNRANVRTSNNDYGPDPANPRPRWMETLTYFPPREVQLGARFRF